MAMNNMRPNGGLAGWMPKKPTTDLKSAPMMQPDAKDDPQCTPGDDSPYTPFARGHSKPAPPFGLGTPGNNQT